MNHGLNFEKHQIAIKPQLKYLGIVIDDKITFCDHVLRLENKPLFRKYIVLRIRNYVRSRWLFYYKTYVNPIIQFRVLIYGCTACTNLHSVLQIQMRIIPNIYFLPKYASVPHYMVANELPTVYELHVYELSKFIIKSIVISLSRIREFFQNYVLGNQEIDFVYGKQMLVYKCPVNLSPL